MKIIKFINALFNSNTKKETEQEVLAILNDGSLEAIKIGKSFNYKLDYSEASIKVVDQILNTIKTIFSREKDEKKLELYAMIFGLYIIDVFERNHEKGYIKRKYVSSGSDDFPYYRKNLIFPCLWCLDKFDNKLDSIWDHYQNVLLEEKN